MIVGCPRSGTTILQTILASHPEVLGIFETHFYCVLCSSNKWARKLGLTPKQAAEILNDMQREYGYHQSQKIRLLSSKYASSLFVKTLDEAASNLGNASAHSWQNLPLVLAGGDFKHGSHIAYDLKENEVFANLFVQIANKMGINIDSFGSSTASSLKGFS